MHVGRDDDRIQRPAGCGACAGAGWRKLPVRTLGMATSRSPACVLSVLAWCPLRKVVRVSVCSPGAAPMWARLRPRSTPAGSAGPRHGSVRPPRPSVVTPAAGVSHAGMRPSRCLSLERASSTRRVARWPPGGQGPFQESCTSLGGTPFVYMVHRLTHSDTPQHAYASPWARCEAERWLFRISSLATPGSHCFTKQSNPTAWSWGNAIRGHISECIATRSSGVSPGQPSNPMTIPQGPRRDPYGDL